jgi:hypothetical protein
MDMDIIEAQPDVRAVEMTEKLTEELRYAPTHIFTEDGIEPITERPEKPSPTMVALMLDSPTLFTGAEWAAMAMSVRVDIAIDVGAPVEAAQDADVLAALPEESLTWLTGWQMMVNSGSCWNTSGSIGRTASALIDEGFLLLAKTATVGSYNSAPGRGDVRPGSKGTPEFVRLVMGEAYLVFISAID